MLKFDPKPLYKFTIVSNGMDYRIQGNSFSIMGEGDESILYIYKEGKDVACFKAWDCIFEGECEDLTSS